MVIQDAEYAEGLGMCLLPNLLNSKDIFAAKQGIETGRLRAVQPYSATVTYART